MSQKNIGVRMTTGEDGGPKYEQFFVSGPNKGKALGSKMSKEQFLDLNKSTPRPGDNPRLAAGKRQADSYQTRKNDLALTRQTKLAEKMKDPEYAKEFERYDTGYDADTQDVNYLQPIANTLEHAWNETENMIDVGMNVYDMVDGWLKPDNKQSQLDVADRMAEQQKRLIEQDPMEEATSLSKGGKMIPYLATGQAEVPIGKAVLGAASGLVRAGGKPLVNAAKIRAQKADDLIAQDAPLKTDINPDFKQKLADKATDIEAGKQFDVPDPYFKDQGSQLAGSTVTGAIEGGTMPDRAGQYAGAGENLLGTHIGTLAGRTIRKLPNERYSDMEKELIHRGETEYGKKYLPGMKTGNKSYQQNEASMRQNTQAMNTLSRFDERNQRVDNKVVSDLLGIENPNGLPVEKIQMENKIGEIKQEFDRLEANSNFSISPKDGTEYGKWVKDLSTNMSPAKERALRELTTFKEVFNFAPVGKGKKKSRKVKQFSGTEFQKMTEDLNASIRKAKMDNDDATVKILTKVREKFEKNVFDQKLNTPVAQGGGKDAADLWKAKRTEYANFMNLEREAYNPRTGNFNMIKYARYLDENDPRYRQSRKKGATMNGVYDMAELAQLEGYQRNSGLSSANIADFDNKDAVDLMERPHKSQLAPVQRAKAHFYTAGYPAKGYGSESTVQANIAAHAAAQAFTPHEKAADVVMEAYDSTAALIDSFYNWSSKEEETTAQ